MVQELKRYEKCEKDSDRVHIVCVDRVKKQVSPFNEGELVVVVGGERSQQRDKNRLQKELGIKNIVDIVFIDNPFYWEIAEGKGISLGDFLTENFESLSENEYEELFKNGEEIIMQNVAKSKEIGSLESYKVVRLVEEIEHNEKRKLLFINEQYKAAKLELKGLFTTQEAWMIVIKLNTVQISSEQEQSEKSILIKNIQEEIHNSSDGKLYDINGNLLLSKLNRLSEFQAYTVLRMTSEFLNKYLDVDHDQNSEDLLNEIFMVSKNESTNHDEICSGEFNQCEENTQHTNLNLQMELAEEKLGHIKKILKLSSGIDIVIGLNEGEYSLFQDCDNCGGYHLLETYSIEEAVALDAETEADDLIETYFTD